MLTFEIALVIFIIGLQAKFFFDTNKQLGHLKILFPNFQLTEKHLKKVIVGEYVFENIEVDEYQNEEFKNIILATNSYLRKNKGSADFNIIKNVAERVAQSQEDIISANIALPLYVGLMGTFSGVIIGLVNLIRQTEFGNSEIQSFIFGVVIAMVASFCGLCFTTLNNARYFKKAKAERDKNKNNYYNFLQTELLPVLNNDLFSALDSLKANISDFNSKFSKNVESFDSVFGGNIKNLKDAVSDISDNIEAITDSTLVQKQFLEELRRIGYTKMAEANIRVFDKMKEVAPMLAQFVNEQGKLNQNVENINGFAYKISALLDRISSFENGLNTLGKDLQQSDILGADMLSLVRRRLTAIEEKEHLVEEYTIKSNDSVKEYLQKAFNKIEELKRKIELDFEKAFDFNAEGKLLQNLNHLKSINDNISILNDKVPLDVIDEKIRLPLDGIQNNTSELVKKVSDTKAEDKLFNKLEDISTQLKDIKAASTKKSINNGHEIRRVNGKRNGEKSSIWSSFKNSFRRRKSNRDVLEEGQNF